MGEGQGHLGSYHGTTEGPDASSEGQSGWQRTGHMRRLLSGPVAMMMPLVEVIPGDVASLINAHRKREREKEKAEYLCETC